MNKNITFLTAFKPFEGSDRIAQRSALYSWSAAKIPIIAPNNEPSILDNCRGFNLILIDGVKTAHDLNFRNKSPVVPDMLVKLLKFVETPMIALINADIIILPDFPQIMDCIMKKYENNIFITGTRFGIHLEEEIKSKNSYSKALQLPRRIYDTASSADIFIASRKIFQDMAKDMPELILGRYAWDNWIHMWAELHIPVRLNCTHSLVTLHCDHDHSHIERQEGKAGKLAPSSLHNLNLFKPFQDRFGQTVRINHWPSVEL